MSGDLGQEVLLILALIEMHVQGLIWTYLFSNTDRIHQMFGIGITGRNHARLPKLDRPLHIPGILTVRLHPNLQGQNVVVGYSNSHADCQV